jgi:hypothetical protein
MCLGCQQLNNLVQVKLATITAGTLHDNFTVRDNRSHKCQAGAGLRRRQAFTGQRRTNSHQPAQTIPPTLLRVIEHGPPQSDPDRYAMRGIALRELS